MRIPEAGLKAYQAASDSFYSYVFKNPFQQHLLGWESVATQTKRFEVFLEEADAFCAAHNIDAHASGGHENNLRLLDAGCGYGALYGYLRDMGVSWNYTGIDSAEQCISECRKQYPVTHSVYPAFFKKNLFEPVAAPQWGVHDFSFLSGVLNLNIDTLLHAGANYEVTLFIVQKLLQASTRLVVCNFLHKKSPMQDDTFFYHDPQKLCAFLESNGITVLKVREDYLPNDMTLVMRAADANAMASR